MYTIEFYEKANGESDVWEFLEKLRQEAPAKKDSRIQYKQAVFYIQLLQDNGTRLPENVTKYLGDGIWELRPGNNFRKKSQKTPRREIEKAKSERDDYLSRKEAEDI